MWLEQAVLVSYCCANKLPKVKCLKPTDLLSYNPRGQKSEMGLAVVKSRYSCWRL